MTRLTEEQFRVLVKSMRAVYTKPEFLPDDDAGKVWYRLLRDIDYKTLSNAVQKHMMTSPFPPTIADLRSAAAQFIPGDGTEGMTELAAWELVRRAIGNSAYNAESEFEKLPSLIQKAVGNPANLREWSQMDIDTVNSVEQSHFLRSYRTVVDREKEMAKLSPVMRDLIESASAGIALEDKAGREAIADEQQTLQNAG